MPKSKTPRARNPRTDRQTRTPQLETLKNMVKRFPSVATNERVLSGLLSQVLGIDEKGNVGLPTLLGSIRGVPTEKRKRIGLLNETLSLPTLLELIGVEPPEFAVHASDQADLMHNAVRDDMRLSEPHGLVENSEDALGVMLGQLPIPSKKKVDIGEAVIRGVGPRLKRLAKSVLGSGPEFLSPTVEPKLGNYISGAGFGGILGSLGDSGSDSPANIASQIGLSDSDPDQRRFAQGGAADKAPTPRTLDRAIADLRASAFPILSSTGDITQGLGADALFPPDFIIPTTTTGSPGYGIPLPDSTPLPTESTKRARLKPFKSLEELLHYGLGPEARYFQPGDPPPEGPVVSVPFKGIVDRFDLNGYSDGGKVGALRKLMDAAKARMDQAGYDAKSAWLSFEDRQKMNEQYLRGADLTAGEESEMSAAEVNRIADILTAMVAKFRGGTKMAEGGKVGATKRVLVAVNARGKRFTYGKDGYLSIGEVVQGPQDVEYTVRRRGPKRTERAIRPPNTDYTDETHRNYFLKSEIDPDRVPKPKKQSPTGDQS
jgi:hypothetical protein